MSNNSLKEKIAHFFSSPAYGVVGASNNRNKFGNKVLRVYVQHHKKVYPVNPNEKTVEGIACTDSVLHLPPDVKSISIVTPPAVTEKIIQQAIEKNIRHVWMQPGAESDTAIHLAEQHNIIVIANGPCILVQLGFEDRD